ncbi:MAG: acyltransferase [Leptospira sp.]|nr:acyltransferase [Leptospira sp.]
MMEWELVGLVLAGTYGVYLILWNLSFPSLETTKHSGREDSIDTIRGFAMTAIVIIHIHSYFAFFHPKDFIVTSITLFLSNICRFSVPSFIFISAMFLNKKNGYWQSKLKNLFIPYFFASLFGYFLKYQSYSFTEFFKFLLLGKVFTPYYFVPLLIQFYILFYFFSDLLKKSNFFWTFLTVSFLANLTSNLGFFDSYLPKEYHSISIFNYVFFFYLGLAWKDLKLKGKKEDILGFSVLFCIFIGITLTQSIQGIDLKNHHLFYPIWGMIFISIFSKYLPSSIRMIAQYIGKRSLAIFLLHPFVIHLMHIFDPYVLGGPMVSYFLTLFLNLTIPLLIYKIITSQMDKTLN